MDYKILYPLVPKDIRSYFPYNVICTIHVGVDMTPIRRLEESTLHPLPHIALVLFDGFPVQKAALAGIALFNDDNSYPYEAASSMSA
jgi:hypothetical protein